MTDSFAALLSDALTCVATECPEAFAELRAALGERRVALDFAHQRLLVDLCRADIAVMASEAPATVSVRASERVLHGLLCGQLDVLGSLLDEHWSVIGEAGDLLAVADSVTLFIKGALRSVSSSKLFDRFEQRVNREAT